MNHEDLENGIFDRKVYGFAFVIKVPRTLCPQ